MQAGRVYHVISRFVAKEFFIDSALERRTYLSLLGAAIVETDWRCFSFAVMSNHIHLGLLAGSLRLAAWLRPMHTNFAQWMNIRRDRIGAVFVRGPNVIEVQPGGAQRLINYIHNNPVRAGLVACPAESDWTSHRAYVERAHRPAWLDVDCGVQLAGFKNQAAFGSWIEGTTTTREELDEMRVVPKARRGRRSLAEAICARAPDMRNPPEQEAGFCS